MLRLTSRRQIDVGGDDFPGRGQRIRSAVVQAEALYVARIDGLVQGQRNDPGRVARPGLAMSQRHSLDGLAGLVDAKLQKLPAARSATPVTMRT